jgi:conjugal transfer/entry exclusion protein
MMPASELQGLKNSLTEEQMNMQNIIAQEKALGNPQMSQFLQNYANTYSDYGTANETPTQAAQGAYNQYSTANTQAAQTAAYGQSILDNSQNNQHLIAQLGANVAAAHGQVAAEQANGQALVALTEEVNQLNKLEAQQAKLKAMQAGAKDSQQAAQANNAANIKIFAVPAPPSVQSGFGQYPNVTNFK